MSTCRRHRKSCGARSPPTPRCPSRRNKEPTAMYEFNYQAPKTLAEANAAISAAEDGKLLAGGMTLIPTLKQRLARPSDVIDLAKIAELKGIRRDGNAIVIGAMTPHAVVASTAEVKQAIPALAALADGIGDPAVRNRGTIGGSPF